MNLVTLGLETQLHDLTSRPLLDQLARRAGGRDAAGVHDHEPVTQLLGLVHVVSGDDKRHAFPLQPVEAVPQQVARLGIETGSRLVQDHEAR